MKGPGHITFISYQLKLIYIYLLFIALFTLSRILFLFSYGTTAIWTENTPDVFKAFFTGFRFDTMVILYSFLGALCLNILFLFIRNSKKQERIIKILILYFTVIFFILAIFQLIDFYFYKFFQSHINLIFFGIIEDDTLAVLKSVWTDYPVIPVVLCSAIFIFLTHILFKRIYKKVRLIHVKGRLVGLLLIVIFFLLYVLGMRGSTDTFPLHKDDATISPNHFINNLCFNGPYAFIDALNDKRKYKISTDREKMLKNLNYKNIQEALTDLCGTGVFNDQQPLSVKEILFTTTPGNIFLEENPPHVIFIVMESWSNYYLNLHNDSLNLLGTLENELPHCILLRNFLSGTNGTIPTIENLMVGTPYSPISQSRYFSLSLETSVALPFNRNGYKTYFITGSKLGWRNIGKYAQAQQFQEVEGQSAILKYVEGAQDCEWGAFDEYLFERVYDIMSNTDSSIFVFGFTTTNHTPFSIPDHYQAYPIKMTQSFLDHLRTDEKIAYKNLRNYQYANDCLGKFINRIRNSSLSENTIIVVTGDHNTLQLIDFHDNDLFYKLSVPLLFYIPESYLTGCTIDLTRFGSHKDIFPTIFNLSLSSSKFLKTGNNLFAKEIDQNFSFALNSNEIVMNDSGCVIIQSKPLYYIWEKEIPGNLIPVTDNIPEELIRIEKKARALVASTAYLIQTEFINQK